MTADLKMMYGTGRLEEQLPQFLDAGESVLALAGATRAGRWWQELRVKTSGCVIVVTDRRVLLVSTGFLLEQDPLLAALYPDPESVPFEDIQAIESIVVGSNPSSSL